MDALRKADGVRDHLDRVRVLHSVIAKAAEADLRHLDKNAGSQFEQWSWFPFPHRRITPVDGGFGLAESFVFWHSMVDVIANQLELHRDDQMLIINQLFHSMKNDPDCYVYPSDHSEIWDKRHPSYYNSAIDEMSQTLIPAKAVDIYSKAIFDIWGKEEIGHVLHNWIKIQYPKMQLWSVVSSLAGIRSEFRLEA